MSEQIHFNGKVYASMDEMPPEIRRAYEQVMGIFADRDGNGMPDVVEGLLSANAQYVSLQGNLANIVFNGKVYHSMDELPPEARQRYEEAMGKMDANRNGIPDFVEGMMSAGGSAKNQSEYQIPAAPTGMSSPSPAQTIEPEGFRGGWLIAAVILFGLLCMAVIGILVLLRQ